MKIEPQPGIVYVKMDKVEAGDLDFSNRSSAVESGTVLAVGEDIKEIKTGDKIFVKAWALDRVTKNGKHYDFVNIESGAILATIKE